MNKTTVLILFLFVVILVATNLLSYSYGSNSFTLTQDDKIVVTEKQRMGGYTRYTLERPDKSFHYRLHYIDRRPFVLDEGDTLNTIQKCN